MTVSVQAGARVRVRAAEGADMFVIVPVQTFMHMLVSAVAVMDVRVLRFASVQMLVTS